MKVCTIKCKQCGREFYTFRSDRKFCPECKKIRKHEADKRRKRTPKKPPEQVHVEANCPVCGKRFIKRTSTQLYCSRKCANDHFNEVNRNRKRKKRQKEIENRPQFKHTCKVCGKIFYNRISNSARCPECIEKDRKYQDNRYNSAMSIRACIFCGSRGKTTPLLICRDCLEKLERYWARNCSYGHRRCLVCDKEFIPNHVECDKVHGLYHVSGQLTCSIGCTDILYNEGLSVEMMKELGITPKEAKND